MSAIRPLATIAVLMVLGVFLWTRINKPDLEQVAESQLALEGMPPLHTEDAAADIDAPPPFVATTDPAGDEEEFNFAPAAPQQPKSIVPADSSHSGGMPELPPLPGSDPLAAAPAKPEGTVTGRVPELGTEVGPTTSDLTAASEPSPESALQQDTMAEAPLADLPQGIDSEFNDEKSAFATARPAIDGALARGEIEEAHRLLSVWYGDSTLTSSEQEEVKQLLNQLAGSVVYSTEHRLEPPHRVVAGETLETIAQKYNVPWQLLAKINSVPEPSAIQPGQELKVVRGPFSALVTADTNTLALMVADRYAGSFTIKAEGQAMQEGEYVVTQKQTVSDLGTSVQQVLLEPADGAASPQLVLGPTSDSAPPVAGAIRVGPRDQEDLYDILSIGSRVIIRR